MGDRWMDERDQAWRERDWRRSETYGHGAEDRGRAGDARRWSEERTWYGGAPDEREATARQAYRDRAREDYGRRSGLTAGGGAYGGEGYRGGLRVSAQDYTGRGYGGGVRGRSYGYERDYEIYSDGVRQGAYGRPNEDSRYRRAERPEAHGEGAGELLHRAGERISSWFRGDSLMRGSREDDGGEPRRYREDWGREARPIPEPNHRGLGPKGYRRSDERICDEVHDRLTDDPWLDASNIEVAVKGGEVTLDGHVDNREGKHRAERIIEDISGVRHVQNNLRVNPEGGLTSAGRGYGCSPALRGALPCEGSIRGLSTRTPGRSLPGGRPRPWSRTQD